MIVTWKPFCVILLMDTDQWEHSLLSSPVVSHGYTSKWSGPYCSNPPFLIFDIWALWRSGLSARVPKCQKIKKGGLDQYGAECFGTHFCHNPKNCGTDRVKAQIAYCSVFQLKVSSSVVSGFNVPLNAPMAISETIIPANQLDGSAVPLRQESCSIFIGRLCKVPPQRLWWHHLNLDICSSSSSSKPKLTTAELLHRNLNNGERTKSTNLYK